MGKNKWEKKYEVLKQMDIDKEIKELKEEIKRLSQMKDDGSDNYKKAQEEKNNKEKQLNRLIKIKPNLSKIENVLKVRDKQVKRLADYKQLIEETNNLDTEIKKLDIELEQLKNRAQDIKNTKSLSRKEKNELKKNKEEQKNNRKAFNEKQKMLKDNKGKIKMLGTDYEKKIQRTKNMMERIAEKLMQGKSMEEITAEFYTASPQTEETKSVFIKDFDQNYQNLAIIKNLIKKGINKVVDYFKKDKSKTNKKSENENDKNDEKLSDKQINEKKAEFYKRITENGRLSNLPTQSKLADELKKQDKVVEASGNARRYETPGNER